MPPTFYRSNMFQLDLRGEAADDALRRLIQEKQDEVSAARKISIRHWTWWYGPSGWKHVDDKTILSSTATGRIVLTRNGGQLGHQACSCDMADLVGAQCPGWKINKPWSLTDFVEALRQEHELLVFAATKLVELIQYHNEIFHVWRDGPKPCQLCGKQMIFLRSSDDVEWASD